MKGHIAHTNKIGVMHNNSFPCGSNKMLEQELAESSVLFDKRIENCKKEYDKILKKVPSLTNEELYKYREEEMLWDVAFDDDMNLISLENRILQLEEYRRRYLSKKCFGYTKRIINKDNQKSCYNSGNGGGNCNKVRVPSLKRSNAV